MINIRTVWVIAGFASFLALLGGCGPGKLVTPEDVLPDQYKEEYIPEEFMNDFEVHLGRDVKWMRCISCDMSWDEWQSHLKARLAPGKYEDMTKELIDEFGGIGSNIPDEDVRKYINIYITADRRKGVMSMNLAKLRELGASMGSNGDILICAGYDLTEEKRISVPKKEEEYNVVVHKKGS